MGFVRGRGARVNGEGGRESRLDSPPVNAHARLTIDTLNPKTLNPKTEIGSAI